MEEAIPTPTEKEQAIATVLEVTKVIPGWFVTEEYLSRLYDENQCGDKDAELRYRANALGHCLVEKYNESRGYTRLDEGYLQAIDWDLSFREKWPVNSQNIPVFPRPTSGDEHLSPEELTKQKVLEAAMVVGHIIPGWYLTYSYLQHVYDKYIEQRKTNNFEDDLNMMGVALKTEFLDRHRLYFDQRRLNDSIYQANAADRFIRRLDWVKSFTERSIQTGSNTPWFAGTFAISSAHFLTKTIP